MRAIGFSRNGAPDVLETLELPLPVLQPHDVLVRVHATSVNPVDTKVRASNAGPRPFPIVLGYDVSGTVEALGPAVTNFGIGDEIFGAPNLFRHGANAERVAIDARTIARKPRSLTHEQAAALPLVSLTAWESLHLRAAVRPGETVLIHAGAGGVGHIAIQLAHLHGCHVVTTAGRAESIAFCRDELGAALVIDHRNDDFVARINDLTQGKGLRAVLDCVGGDTFRRSIECVAVNGALVTILGVGAGDQAQQLLYKNVTVHHEFMGVPAAHGIAPERHGEILRGIASLADRGWLRPHVAQTLPLARLADGHRAVETGRTIGKIVIGVS